MQDYGGGAPVTYHTRRAASIPLHHLPRSGYSIEQRFEQGTGNCPRWLDVSAKAFIIAAGIVSVALWVAF
jgi:hypothetical protein